MSSSSRPNSLAVRSPARPHHPATQQVQLQISRAEHRRLGAGAALAEQGSDAGEQFGKGEGL